MKSTMPVVLLASLVSLHALAEDVPDTLSLSVSWASGVNKGVIVKKFEVK